MLPGPTFAGLRNSQALLAAVSFNLAQEECRAQLCRLTRRAAGLLLGLGKSCVRLTQGAAFLGPASLQATGASLPWKADATGRRYRWRDRGE